MYNNNETYAFKYIYIRHSYVYINICFIYATSLAYIGVCKHVWVLHMSPFTKIRANNTNNILGGGGWAGCVSLVFGFLFMFVVVIYICFACLLLKLGRVYDKYFCRCFVIVLTLIVDSIRENSARSPQCSCARLVGGISIYFISSAGSTHVPHTFHSPHSAFKNNYKLPFTN